MRRSGLPALVLATLAAAFLVACGGDGGDAVATQPGTDVTQGDLESAARAGRDEVAGLTEQLRDARSSDDVSAALAQGAVELRERADEVEAAEAEGDAAEARDRFAAALRSLADDAEAAAADVAEEDYQQAGRTVLGGDALAEVQRAIDDLRAAGVDVEELEAQTGADLSAEASRIQAELDTLMRDLSTARSSDDVADAMEAAADRLREAADELAAAEAGAELEPARDDTADAARRLADELEAAAPAARDADLQQALADARAMNAIADVRRGLDELRRRGVDVQEAEAGDLEVAARQARDEVDRALTDLRDARSAGDVADRMEEGAERIRSAADEVEAAETRSDTEDAQRRLADALRDLADELEAAAPEIRDGNVAQALQRVQALEAVNEIDAALQELRAQGVDVPDLSR